jgi:hypothetical protein
MYLLVAVIGGILGALLGATLIAAVDNEAVAAVFYTIVNTLSSLITLPLMASVLTVIYFDLRVRNEGFDLQLLARGVGQDGSAYATSPQAVGESSGLGGYAPPSTGGFAPPRAPESTPPPSVPPPSDRGLQSGDPLAPERREDDGGAAS